MSQDLGDNTPIISTVKGRLIFPSSRAFLGRVMQMRRAIAAGTVLWGAGTTHAVVPEYSVLDLGTLGGVKSEAFGLNDGGRVVGWSKKADGTNQAFATSVNSPINLATDALPLPPGATEDFAYGINATGKVAGVASTSAGDRAFLYSNGTATTLGTLGGDWSYAYAINGLGQVVGGAAKPASFLTYPTHAFVYDGTMHDLGTLGGIESYAHSINAAGQIVGYSQLQPTPVGYTPVHAFVWKPNAPNGSAGQMSDLGTLGGTTSYAFSINDSGQIVGGANTLGDIDYHAFLRTADTVPQMIDLGTLGGPTSEAHAINNLGLIVGDSDSPSGSHAFVYADGAMHDLNALIPTDSNWLLEQARSINTAGQIVGSGTSPSGQAHGCLLTPLPTWRVDSGGSWSNSANWLGAVPDGAIADVRFTGAITAPRTVVLDAARTVGRIVFDNASAYTLAGPGTLTVMGSASGNTGLQIRLGHHIISAPLRFAGSGAVVTLAAGRGLSFTGGVEGTVARLDIASGGTLDLARGSLIVDYASNDTSPLASISAAISSGYAGGVWTGTGTRSSLAAADPNHRIAIGYAEASSLGLATFGGYPTDSSAVLLRVTLEGDANLSGLVDSLDFNRFSAGYGIFSGEAVWTQGDFDYNGKVNTLDFNMMAANFGQALPGSLPSAALGVFVPEPSIVPAALGMLCMARRRRILTRRNSERGYARAKVGKRCGQ